MAIFFIFEANRHRVATRRNEGPALAAWEAACKVYPDYRWLLLWGAMVSRDSKPLPSGAVSEGKSSRLATRDWRLAAVAATVTVIVVLAGPMTWDTKGALSAANDTAHCSTHDCTGCSPDRARHATPGTGAFICALLRAAHDTLRLTCERHRNCQ